MNKRTLDDIKAVEETMKEEARTGLTTASMITWLKKAEAEHGVLQVFFNDDSLDESQLQEEDLVVSSRKNWGLAVYNKRVTIKIWS